MKNVFLDTNVLIDFLADRKPFSVQTANLFHLAKENKIRLYISAVSYNNIYYVLRQSLSNAAAIKLLNELFELVEITDVTKMIIRRST